MIVSPLTAWESRAVRRPSWVTKKETWSKNYFASYMDTDFWGVPVKLYIRTQKKQKQTNILNRWSIFQGEVHQATQSGRDCDSYWCAQSDNHSQKTDRAALILTVFLDGMFFFLSFGGGGGDHTTKTWRCTVLLSLHFCSPPSSGPAVTWGCPGHS